MAVRARCADRALALRQREILLAGWALDICCGLTVRPTIVRELPPLARFRAYGKVFGVFSLSLRMVSREHAHERKQNQNECDGVKKIPSEQGQQQTHDGGTDQEPIQVVSAVTPHHERRHASIQRVEEISHRISPVPSDKTQFRILFIAQLNRRANAFGCDPVRRRRRLCAQDPSACRTHAHPSALQNQRLLTQPPN